MESKDQSQTFWHSKSDKTALKPEKENKRPELSIGALHFNTNSQMSIIAHLKFLKREFSYRFNATIIGQAWNNYMTA